MFPPLRLRAAFDLGGLSVRELTLRTWKKINEHEIMTRASAVSFYAMLAFVPFLALILTFSVRLLPDLSQRGGGSVGIGNLSVDQFEAILARLVPPEAFSLVKDQIERIQKQPPVGLLSIGLAITIWLASSLFLAIIDAMDRIYGVVETRPFWKLRLTAIVMTVIQAVILLGSLAAIALWPQIIQWTGLHQSPMLKVAATAVTWFLVFVMVTISFALTYYVGPDAQQRWEWISPGSLFGTVVFLLASLLFRVYVQNFGSYDKTYGSLGGVMVILFWFWISSLVLLTAGEVNKAIEDASPLGKSYGQKKETAAAPDFSAATSGPESPPKS